MNAFVSAIEAAVDDPEIATELNRALRKEGAEYVQKVKDKRKEVAKARMAAEKEVSRLSRDIIERELTT